jgi:hypothetical protein
MNKFFESDEEWMTLEDYCLERGLLLDQTQLIRLIFGHNFFQT